MKRYLLAGLILLLGITGAAHADRGDQYVLGKVGFMTLDVNNADLLFSFGALYGYGITPEITVEGEINLGLLGGGYEQKNTAGVVYEEGEYSVITLAGYGVYRLPVTEALYLKGKGGLLFESVNRSGKFKDGSATGVGLAGGIGAGGRVADMLTLEGEITAIDEDIIFFSLGVHYAFK